LRISIPRLALRGIVGENTSDETLFTGTAGITRASL
jgi:hypothetical protein